MKAYWMNWRMKMFNLFDYMISNWAKYLEGSDSKISEHERDQLREALSKDMDPVKRSALKEVLNTGNRKGPLWIKYCKVN